MNVYELNKTAYTNVPPMEEHIVRRVIYNFLCEHESSYYFMLNHDIHYYTLFHTHNFNTQKMADEMFDIIDNLGDIVDIMINQETEMLEVWIKYDGEPMMFGIFDYARGVVEV